MMPPADIIYVRTHRLSGRPPEMSRFVTDAKSVLPLSFETLNAIAADLDASTSFLDREAVHRTVSRHVADEEQARRITRLLTSFDSLEEDRNPTVAGVLSSIAKWMAETENAGDAAPLSSAEFGRLGEQLPLLLKRYEGLVRQSKAERLSEVTGQRLESIDLICDLRPVFDGNHTCVVGVIPLTTVKLVCTGGDGLPVTTEAVLSERQVSDLARLAQDAAKKLIVLRGLADEAHKLIPAVPVTEQAPVAGRGGP
jgi:hypothetical protein